VTVSVHETPAVEGSNTLPGKVIFVCSTAAQIHYFVVLPGQHFE
jgi:hypothetical protein